MILDLAIETRTTADLSLAQRRAKIAGGYPIALRDADPELLRAKIATATAKAGRPAGARGGGNTTKRLRIYLHDGASRRRVLTEATEARNAAKLERYLAGDDA